MTTGYRYPMRKCPYCGRHFANVKNHILMKHGTSVIAELTAGDLLGAGSSRDKPADPDPEFFCTGCGAIVKRGDDECWQCGEELQWQNV